MSGLFVLLFTLVLLCVLEYSHQQVENDGGCSCSCSSADVQTSAHSSGFQQGQPGKRGPLGPPGSPGQQGIQGPPGEGFSGSYGSAFNPGRSCADLRTNGITEDGVYFIKTGSISSVFQVYCDMSTGSTGWTLVGSIHENNVFGKCTQGDKWSSEEGNTNITNEGKAWTDTDIFGNVESATSADYKNPGFFTLASSNVMLWHVPNDTPLSRYKQDATLMYATDNNFLSLKGFTLQSLFKDHYSLTKHSGKGTNVIDSFINAATASAQQITNAITSFHQYTYDPSQSSAIPDGGNDLFDNGNKIQYAINDNSLSADLVYGHTYADSGVQIKTWPGHPFIALAYFRSTSNVNTLKLRVSSNLGADGSGSVTTYTGTLNAGNTVIYRANHVYGAGGDPSCAQVFFFMTDHPHSSDSVSTPEWENSDTQNLDDTFMVRLSQTTGPRNIIVGYMLLSKTSGSQITSGEIETAIQRLMTPLSTVLRVADVESCSSENETLFVPVNVLRGEITEVTEAIPNAFRSSFQPGFIHFRPFDKNGIPRAMCPGVRSDGCSPYEACVGGINTYKYDQEFQCGDFVRHNLSAILVFYGP